MKTRKKKGYSLFNILVCNFLARLYLCVVDLISGLSSEIGEDKMFGSLLQEFPFLGTPRL